MSIRQTHIITAAQFHEQGTSAFAVLAMARWHFNSDNKDTGHALRKIAHELAPLNGERLRTFEERAAKERAAKDRTAKSRPANDNRRPFQRRAA